MNCNQRKSFFSRKPEKKILDIVVCILYNKEHYLYQFSACKQILLRYLSGSRLKAGNTALALAFGIASHAEEIWLAKCKQYTQ